MGLIFTSVGGSMRLTPDCSVNMANITIIGVPISERCMKTTKTIASIRAQDKISDRTISIGFHSKKAFSISYHSLINTKLK